MAASTVFKEFLDDLFVEFGPITMRNMFGGAGVYHAGVMIALVANDTLFLKADAQTFADFEAEGMKPFTYDGKGKPVQMSYWEVPHAVLDDPEDFAEWAWKEHAAALRSRRN